MGMGRREQQRRQEELWIAHTELPRTVPHSFYEQLNRLLEARGFDAWVEQPCARFYAERMGGPVWRRGGALAADWIFRGHRQRTRDCVAGGGFAGAAEFSGGGIKRDAAGSLDDLADAAADRCGNASSVVPLGAGVAGGEGSAEGEDGRHRCHDLGGERGAAL